MSPKYDVFLSFRGEDTRDNFTSHLYAELRRKNIETFIDNNSLDRGEEISPALYRAIEESKIYVIILSEHYASSSWCLDELTEILKCKERYGREVIPVFYKVDPSNVRHQRQSYAEDFVKHQQRTKDKVDAWKAALFQVAGLSGWDSQNIRPESTLVTEIVKDIVKKSNRCVTSDCEGMTGIDNHIEKIQSLLLLGSPTVQIIGIWGMGGIGKTTIANAIFEKLATQFSSKSIIRNVQQEIERFGLSHVKKEYLSQLLNETITSSESNSYDQRLKRTKSLLVFDDVKDADQLKDIIGTHHKFGQGSRIIVTSRDRQVLENANADEIYQVREMDDHDSLQLFCLFAFKQNHPKESFVSLTKKVLDYAQGLPLALKVLGSLLYGRTTEAWESELQKLEKLPDLKIFRLLKLSYDGLDEDQKDIFLDIACFYRGERKKVVKQNLDCCGFSAGIGMNVLEDKCLISISEHRVWMHDLIQEMGREIVRLQCVHDPGKRSRLWKFDDIYDVLSKNQGTNEIQCIFCCEMWKIAPILHTETFKKMNNVRMIQFTGYSTEYHVVKKKRKRSEYAILCPFLESLPDGLKLLHWDSFPQRSLPLDFCSKNLVLLDMRCSFLEQLWEGNQALPNLKRLNLSYSKKLIRVPDLSLSPDIEEVILSGCVSLIQIYSSSFLNKLNWLCLDGCTELKSLNIQSNILSRSSGFVGLRGCYNLQTLIIRSKTDVVQLDSWPPFHDGYKSVVVFYDNIRYDDDQRGYRIGGYRIYGDDPCIKDLCWLDISKCESLTCLPAELLNLKFLTKLSLSGCFNLAGIPEIKETMENLKVLMLDETAIKELPSSLHRLAGLEELNLQSCRDLKTIPSSIGNLSKLLELNLAHCLSLETFPSSIFKLNLTALNFEGCSKLKIFPEILEPAEGFTYINLTNTAIKELPSSVHHLVGLEELSLDSCTQLKTIPSSIGNLSKLLKLNLANCASLETFPSSIFKLKLKKLNFEGCSKLKTFPEILEPTESFTHINLTDTAIKELPSSLQRLVRLEELSLQRCRELKTIPSSIGNLSKLLELNLAYCLSLETFPSSILKLNLTKLDFEGCSKLKTFPEILEPTESFTHINLTNTAIKVLPSSLHRLAGLEELSLQSCRELKTTPSFIGNLSKLLKLNLAYCLSLETFPSSIFKLNLTGLNFEGCSKLKIFPDILEPAESFTHINLTNTAIKELPSSVHHLVGLEELSLDSCTQLKTIPSSIGNLSKLLKLVLTNCASLETFPSSIFKLKLKKLNFKGCSMLKTFPEILEPVKSFVLINLQETAIKELPSSLHLLVGLEALSLQGCTELKTIPSSIGNLSKLFRLDLVYCASLETFPSSIFKLKLTRLDFKGCSMLGTFPEIPNESACLSSLTELSLQGSSIVNLPESMAHLTSLKLLNLSNCKLLECVPKLPPNLTQVSAINCPSMKRMMLNSRSDFEEGTLTTFKFYLTNSQELDATSLGNIEEEARIKINDDAYKSVIFCFPGSSIPGWFPYHLEGHSITTNLYGENRLIGFALCVVLEHDFPYELEVNLVANCLVPDIGFKYKLRFESDDHTHLHSIELKIVVRDELAGQNIFSAQHHTFVWKYELDLARIGNGLIDGHTITFEILDQHGSPLSFPSTMKVKECGICPLYSSSKENDDDGIEEASGDAVYMCSGYLSSNDNYTQNKRRKMKSLELI